MSGGVDEDAKEPLNLSDCIDYCQVVVGGHIIQAIILKIFVVSPEMTKYYIDFDQILQIPTFEELIQILLRRWWEPLDLACQRPPGPTSTNPLSALATDERPRWDF